VLNDSKAPFFKWFEDGTLNVSYNCLDRNVERGLGGKTAIIFEADDGEVTKVSYSRAAGQGLPVRQRAEGARREEGRPRRHLHVDERRRRGRHAGLRPHRRHPLGGVRRLLAQSLRDRIEDAGAVMVITADEQMRGGKRCR
jgi:acetyl-CoA synthetase